MVPTKCPVSRAFISYISLLLINIINIYTKESTSYFPSKYLIINKLTEIQPIFLTVGRTPNQEKIGVFERLLKNQTFPFHWSLKSLDTTSIRGI